MSSLRLVARALLLCAVLVVASPPARALDWASYAETSVVEILTRDAGGEGRETSVWIVVVDGTGWVRTNDSRWLANIRRGSPVSLRVEGREDAVRVREVDDPAVTERVEQAFLAKYGTIQRIMSAVRTSEPTVLRLDAAAP